MSAIPSPTKATDESLRRKKSLESEDAFRLIQNIKARFQGDDRYKAFLDILISYRKGNCSVEEVCNKVSVLLKDHVDLLVEFIKFLPSTHASLPMDQEILLKMSAVPSPTKATDESLRQKKSVAYEDAYRLLQNIKDRFLCDDRYKTFVDILRSFKNGSCSVEEVYNKVSVLLKDHVDLLVEFIKFLPSTHASLPMDQMSMMIKSLEL